MEIIRHRIFDLSRPDTIRVIPIGDIHLGAKACDEKLLQHVVNSIKSDPLAYWIGMGDACDFINRSDRRFDPTTVASWVDLTAIDVAQQQIDRFLEIFSPIASKCLCILKGNHERDIALRYENDVYDKIVTGIRHVAEFPLDYKLRLGYSGWLILTLYAGSDLKSRGRQYKFKLHHGFGGGKLAGGKALNMEKWLWLHDCDIALMGHTHEKAMPLVRSLVTVQGQSEIEKKKIGAWTGTFLQTNVKGASTYSEVKGYFPRPVGGIEIQLHHGAVSTENSISVIAGI